MPAGSTLSQERAAALAWARSLVVCIGSVSAARTGRRVAHAVAASPSPVRGQGLVAGFGSAVVGGCGRRTAGQLIGPGAQSPAAGGGA